MSPRGNGFHPDAAPTPQSDAHGSPDSSAGVAAPLFVERRRTLPIENAWHEALDRVHHLLQRYEDLNRELTESEEGYRRLIEDSPAGIFRLTPTGEPVFVNPAMAMICGFDSPGDFTAAIPRVGATLFACPTQWVEIVTCLRSHGGQHGVETEIISRDGSPRWVQLKLRAIQGSDSLLYVEGTAEDITERRRAEEQIRQLAFYDQVTGLPNKALFEEYLREYVSTARRRGENVALILLEVSRFKLLNDSLGRTFGDHLLRSVAERIQKATIEGDVVARFSGAEFAVLLPSAGDRAAIDASARRILAEVSAEFSCLGHVQLVSCAAGISIFPENAADGDALLQQADVAMYSARERGLAEVCFFNVEMKAQMSERLRLEKALRHALDREELFLVYQPQIDIRTGGVCGLEALLRWQHPDRGLIPPADFIGVAESCGLIIPIGEWVLRTACLQAMAWQRAGFAPVPVAVNVSAIQFRQQGFCELVRSVLAETGLDPKYLELELTEGLLLTNADVVFNLIQELRGMGVKLTIDDFGTGYSSLGYLRQFKVNRLKIDRSFVRDVPLSADDSAITTAIIRMARALNLEVVAEGVENADQLSFLRDQNCYEVQGYYFSKPIGVEQVTGQLRMSSPC